MEQKNSSLAFTTKRLLNKQSSNPSPSPRRAVYNPRISVENKKKITRVIPVIAMQKWGCDIIFTTCFFFINGYLILHDAFKYLY